jgi:hypothetical protein
MPVPWIPPRRAYHLRIFVVSLTLVVIGLAAFLLGVRMEAVAPATGTITARDLCDVRTLLPGLIEPGWYESEVAVPGASPRRVRLDSQGNGLADPAGEVAGAVREYELRDADRALRIQPESVRFHRLEPGDELWPGQLLAAVRADDWRFELKQIEDQLRMAEGSGNQAADSDRLRARRDALRHQLSEAQIHVPATGKLWLAVQVRVAPLQAVQPGDVIATIVPVDPESRQPLDLIARLEVDEKHCGDLAPGQIVHLQSDMHNHRLHGQAEARVERIEPWGEPATDGQRRYTVIAPVTQAPFPLALGSTVKAEVVVGRKVVYRIILEH